MRSVSAVIGLLATLGFAGAANAAQTLDLLWGGTSVSTSVSVNASTIVSLHVVLTNNGPLLSQGAGVTIDYSDAIGSLTVAAFTTNPDTETTAVLPIILGSTTDTGSQVRNINAAAFIPYVGTGLGVGASYLLGTVTFQQNMGGGSFTIESVLTATDDAIDENGDVDSVTLNSAFISVPEPGTIATMLAAVSALVGIGWVRRSDRAQSQT